MFSREIATTERKTDFSKIPYSAILFRKVFFAILRAKTRFSVSEEIFRVAILCENYCVVLFGYVPRNLVPRLAEIAKLTIIASSTYFYFAMLLVGD